MLQTTLEVGPSNLCRIMKNSTDSQMVNLVHHHHCQDHYHRCQAVSHKPVALDGDVGLETAEPLAADDDRLTGKGSRNAVLRPVLVVASSLSSRVSDTLCRWPLDAADDGSLLG